MIGEITAPTCDTAIFQHRTVSYIYIFVLVNLCLCVIAILLIISWFFIKKMLD